MYPFQFNLLWQLGEKGPMTAAELAACPGLRVRQAPAQLAGSLRPLVARGLVVMENRGRGPGIYRLSFAGRRIVDA